MWNYIVLQYKTLQWEFGGIVVFIVLQCIECKGHTSPKHGGMLIPWDKSLFLPGELNSAVLKLK